ncbi:hypothetical protein CEE39_10325 [bacterium (candidate division B38) B3_B38]|nr:MAG: hypothetical protein CEE39_10325 [bacterium (candidate division B38) B3_B38]
MINKASHKFITFTCWNDGCCLLARLFLMKLSFTAQRAKSIAHFLNGGETPPKDIRYIGEQPYMTPFRI